MNLPVRFLFITITLPMVLILIFTPLFRAEESKNTDITQDEQLQEEIRWYVKVREMILDRCAVEVEPKDLFYGSLKGMTQTVPYASFYTPEEEPRFEEDLSGEYIGLGLYCRIEDDRLLVHKRIYQSPAYALLEDGDEIMEVNGGSVAGLSIEEAYALMRSDGRMGSRCILKIKKAKEGTVEEIRLERARIKKPSVVGWILPEGEPKIGYIWINHFLTQTDNEFWFTLQALMEEGITSLILDLRFNRGGVLDCALAVANIFLGEGTLVITRGRRPEANQVYAANRARCRYPDLPLVVLINGKSASAAEVLAGALQDHKRAVLMGTHSFGKGVVQAAIQQELFGKPAIIKIPTALYFLPSGRCIERELYRENPHGGGLYPDITIPLNKNTEQRLARHLGEISLDYAPELGVEGRGLASIPDTQREAAVRLLKGEKVFTPLTSPNKEDREY
jgi:carboxyl-terminal processing protease